MAQPLIIIGQHAGGAARSAKRAGYAPYVIDTMQCEDTPADAGYAHCPPDRFPFGVLDLLRDAPQGASVLPVGPMENHPDLVEAIAKDFTILGSQVPAIKKVRHPYALPSMPAYKGLRFCKTRTRASFARRIARLAFGVLGKRYLLKPRFTSGGEGIDWWSPTARLGDTHYLQQFVKGTPMSAVYDADGWSCQLRGVSEMVVGDPTYGAATFAWCGSIGPVKLSKKATAALQHLGVVLTQRHDLRGVFGVDLIMDWRGNLWPVEVNPRWPESAEVIERAGSFSVLGPAPSDTKKGRKKPEVHGLAVLFAKQGCTVGELPDYCVDRPVEGAVLKQGQRLCTVLAQAKSARLCESQLRERVGQVYPLTKPQQVL